MAQNRWNVIHVDNKTFHDDIVLTVILTVVSVFICLMDNLEQDLFTEKI